MRQANYPHVAEAAGCLKGVKAEPKAGYMGHEDVLQPPHCALDENPVYEMSMMIILNSLSSANSVVTVPD